MTFRDIPPKGVPALAHHGEPTCFSLECWPLSPETGPGPEPMIRMVQMEAKNRWPPRFARSGPADFP